jgi:hypothetical protein
VRLKKKLSIKHLNILAQQDGRTPTDDVIAWLWLSLEALFCVYCSGKKDFERCYL